MFKKKRFHTTITWVAKDPVFTDFFEDAVSCQWLFPRGRDDKIIITFLGQSHVINNLFITKLHFVRIS